MDDAVNFSDMMTALRKKYFAQLKDCQKLFSDFLSACEKGTPTEELCQEMRRQAHNLAGSGATYGFSDVSTTARALEHKLEDGVREGGVLANHIRALIAACDRAMGSGAVVATDAAITASKSLEATNKPTLLIAEDDASILDLLVNMFKADMTIIAAKNGREALEKLKERQPDLIIMDNQMPEIGGSELLQALRGKPETANIPVVMLTANNREKDVMRGLTGGAVEYVVKPFNPNWFADRIRTRLLRQRYIVMIADDDAAIRDMLDYKFRSIGCRTLLAENGEDALKIAEKNTPDLIILDRMMPGLDGVAVLKKLHETEVTQKIPVVMLTVRRQEQDILEGFRLGAADYIVKPFKPEELIARSMRCLKEKKA